MKLLPPMSLAFAFIFAHASLMEKYKQLQKEVKENKFDLLDEIHHYGSGMKAVCSDIGIKNLYKVT